MATASRRDYAEAAANVLAGQGHAGKTYELGGDNPVTLTEYAGLLSDLAGRAVVYVDLDEKAYRTALVGAGLPESFAAILADSDAKAAAGALETDSRDLRRLIGRRTTPMREMLKKLVA